MIAFIKGFLVQLSPVSIVIECNGVGYKLYIPPTVFSRLPALQQEVLIHTSFVIREMSQTLYGFLSIQERDLFEILMGINGIGPKLALSIIGHLPLDDLNRAITTHDISTLCKVPGIGKKTAERLIIEMRDKLSPLLPPDPSDIGIQMFSNFHSHKMEDAIRALINLGYNQISAQKAIKKTLNELSGDIDLGTLITVALKNI